MNEYTQKRKEEAEAFALEISQFVPAVGVENSAENEFKVVIIRGNKKYIARRDFHGIISVSRPHDYGQYVHVSSYSRNEEYMRTVGQLQKMKAMSAKKLDAAMNAEDAYHARMQELESVAVIKIKNFLDTLEGMSFACPSCGHNLEGDRKEDGSITILQ